MSSISTRIGLIASLASAVLIATPRDAAAWAPTTLDCANLVPWFQSNNYGWWWGALGNCKTGPGGPTTFEAIFQCALAQVEPKYQLQCVVDDLRGAPNTASGVDVVAAYNGVPTCTYLFKKYGGDYGWWTNAIKSAAIGPPSGLTNRDAIFNFAFGQLPKADQQACLSDLFNAVGDVTETPIKKVIDFNTPGDCKPLIDTYKTNGYKVWWNALGKLKTGPGGLSTRAEIIAAAFKTLDPRDQQPCLLDHLSGLAVTDAGVFVVRAHNGIPFSVGSNTATEPPSAPELCDLSPSSLADNYFASKVPFSFLEGGGPTTPSNFNVPAGQNLGSDEGRLSSDFRRVAQLADPIQCALPLAAHTFAEAEAAGPGPAQNMLRATAQAYADLAVTGTEAFKKFQSWNPTPANFCAAIEKRTQPPGCLAFVPATDDQLRTGCVTALSRAYRVANFLRVGQALRVEGNWYELGGQPTITATVDQVRKGAERLALGWIAVSGEDDAPHRPVNVPSSDHPQYNIDVDVEAPARNIGVEVPRFGPVPVRARYTIAQSNTPKPGPITYHPMSNPFVLDPDPVPSIANGSEVILFIHGMDSRGEEATDITRHLFGVMTTSETPKNLVMITVDLPSSGYTETLDYDRISGLAVIGHPEYAGFLATGLTPMLDFLETFVVRFVEKLPAHLAVPASMKAVMGGSLGGNLTFRLGRRANTPWVRNVVTWSAASIWTGLGEGNSPITHEAVSRSWNWANDRNASDRNDLSPARLARRKDFFSQSWDQKISDPFVPLTQPETWTSDSYRCKLEAIAASRMDRQETYSPKFLSWRWRLGAEQLLYSHQTYELGTGQRRFMRNDKRMFLSCGTEDDVPTNEICDATQVTADEMTLTPGMARYLPVTGHSVDAERPRYFARKMDEFLGLR